MVSAVKSRPNHYEALGLSPTARADEIGRAFVKKMSLFGAHPMDEAAQILIAYETLRNPEKRREYDASIGLGAKPMPALRQWSFAIAPPRWSPFIASAEANQKEVGPAPSLEPHATAEPARPAPAPREIAPKPKPRQQPARPDSQGALDALVHHIRAVGRSEKESLRQSQPRVPDWKKPVLAVSGLVLGAGLIGTLAGLSVTDNETPAQAEPARTSMPAKHSGIADQPAAALETRIDEKVRRRLEPDLPKLKSRRVERLRPSSLAERGSLDLGGTSEQAVGGIQPAPAIAAAMPLSSSLVARTIERIGYACGEIASTTAVEGEEGVYKVTCSSGQSYQATPVHGRYRFRRLGAR